MDDPTWIAYGRADLIISTTVEGTLYGFTFALYLLCARSLYLQLGGPDHRKHNLITLLHVSLVMICGLLGLAMDARQILVSYVDHADYPDGGLGYRSDIVATQPIAIMGYAVGAVLDTLTYGIQIWRLWTIWQMSRYCHLVVILPALTFLGYMGVLLTSTVRLVQNTESESLAVSYTYANMSLGLATTVMVTLLIIGRIALVRWRHLKIMGQSDTSRQYTSIISMLVESYALESLWMTIILILNFAEDPSIQVTRIFFFDTLPFVQILAYLLILYRVTTGRGWKEDTERNLTTLQWNRDELQTTQLGTRASLPISEIV